MTLAEPSRLSRTPARPGLAASPRTSPWEVPEVRWAALATVLFAAGGTAHLAGSPPAVWWAFYLSCYLAGGWEPALAGLRALRERTLDVDLLMVAAAIGAASIGQVFDGALLIVIFATSGALEAWATRRTADSVRRLLTLAPPTATRVAPDGTETVVATSDLAVGDVLLVRPGERIGADGHVLDGKSDIDQATITGEPLPVPKGSGDDVFAGTLNGAGAFRMRVDRPATDSVVSRIVRMVEEATASKSPTQLFIEKVEQRYSAGVVVATLAVFAVPLAFGATFDSALLRAMTFMIVASPCAVVLATMPPLLAAIANASRHGVLVKSAAVMERLGRIDVVAFDKTGTLTSGRPVVDTVRLLPDTRLSRDRILALAAAAERQSEHPLAAAVVNAAHTAGLAVPAATSFHSLPGRGVHADVAGHRVAVGHPNHAGQAEPHVRDVVDDVSRAGYTAIMVTIDERPAAVLAVTDQIRPAADAATTALTTLTGRPPVLLTGDNAGAAARLSASLRLSDVCAGLLPQDKVAAVAGLQAGGATVLVVGDGVNDAPALATADVGVAMGRTGADLALDTADAVVVRDDLHTIPAVVALARRARRCVIANLVFAGAVIAVLAGWDIFGTLPLPLGVAGHEGSTVVVALNGLRLLRRSAWMSRPDNR